MASASSYHRYYLLKRNVQPKPQTPVNKLKLIITPKQSQSSAPCQKRWTERLPLVVKHEVFSYLRLDDRKSVRLVCRDWYLSSWTRTLCSDDHVIVTDGQHVPYDTCLQALCDDFERSSVLPYSITIRNVDRRCGVERRVKRRTQQQPQHRKRDGVCSVAEQRFWSKFGDSVVSLTLRDVRLSGEQSLQLLSQLTVLERLTIEGGDIQLPARLCSRASVSRLHGCLSRLKCLTLDLHRPIDNLELLLLSEPPLIPHLDTLQLSNTCRHDHRSTDDADSSDSDSDGDGDAADEDRRRRNGRQLSLQYVRIVDGRRGRDRNVSVSVNTKHVTNGRLAELLREPDVRLMGLELIAAYPDQQLCDALAAQRSSLRRLSIHLAGGEGNPFREHQCAAFVETVLSLVSLRGLYLDAAETTIADVDAEVAALGWRAYQRLPRLRFVGFNGSSWPAAGKTLPTLPEDPNCSKNNNNNGSLADRHRNNLRALSIARMPLLGTVMYMAGVPAQLSQLVCLELRRLPDLNDYLFQEICNKLPHLLHLSLIDCERVSDYGLIGPSWFNRKYSIKNLATLRLLEIESRHLSDTALSAIEFTDLRSVHLRMATDRLSRVGLRWLAEQNPRLSELQLSFYHRGDGNRTDAAVGSVKKGGLGAKDLAEFVRKAKCLRKLGMSSMNKTIVNYVLRVARKECPSLRYINDQLIHTPAIANS